MEELFLVDWARNSQKEGVFIPSVVEAQKSSWGRFSRNEFVRTFVQLSRASNEQKVETVRQFSNPLLVVIVAEVAALVIDLLRSYLPSSGGLADWPYELVCLTSCVVLESQHTETIEDDDKRCPIIGEHGHPECRCTKNSEYEKDEFCGQRDEDILLDNR